MSEIRQIGIDVHTKGAAELRRRLSRLKSTVSVTDGGVYREDPAWSQVHLDTTLDFEELDDWLWKRSTVEYAGTWERAAA